MSVPRPIVTLTTDFGTGSPYVAAMKGTLLSVCPEANIVDISHAIAPQDIAAAARVLDRATPWFPLQTIHVAVVDPGVGTERAIIYAEIGTQRYVCPDNGLLTCLAAREMPRRIVTIQNPAYWQPQVSATFHGRDIMAPVAGHLCLGLDPLHLGAECEQIVTIPLPQASIVGQKITGAVVEIDSFGNLITNITRDHLASVPTGEATRVVCDDHETFGLYSTYGDQPAMTLIALVGSSGQLELAIVDDSAAMMLGVRVGAPVVVAW